MKSIYSGFLDFNQIELYSFQIKYYYFHNKINLFIFTGYIKYLNYK